MLRERYWKRSYSWKSSIPEFSSNWPYHWKRTPVMISTISTNQTIKKGFLSKGNDEKKAKKRIGSSPNYPTTHDQPVFDEEDERMHLFPRYMWLHVIFCLGLVTYTVNRDLQIRLLLRVRVRVFQCVPDAHARLREAVTSTRSVVKISSPSWRQLRDFQQISSPDYEFSTGAKAS